MALRISFDEDFLILRVLRWICQERQDAEASDYAGHAVVEAEAVALE
jgi:hypothetical protein